MIGFIANVDLFDRGEDFAIYRDQIRVIEIEMAFGEKNSRDTVAVIGTITNRTSVPWEGVYFNVDFLDASGRRVDVGHEHEMFYFVPPNSSSSFKISFPREFPKTNYVEHKVRIVGAKDARGMW